MPAFRIVYTRGETQRPETVTASFNDLDQALGVFAARGLRILYIAESDTDARPLDRVVDRVRRADAPKLARSGSFPLRRFSRRVMA